MAETLRIEIDVSAARKGLNALKQDVGSLETRLVNFNSKGGESVAKFAQQVNNLKPISSATISSFTQLAVRAEQLSRAANLKGLTSELNRLSKLDTSRVATAMSNLSSALARLRVPAALRSLPSQLNAIAAGARNAATAVNQAGTSFTRTQRGAAGLGNSFSSIGSAANLARNVLAGFGVTLGAIGFARFISSAFEAVTIMDKFANTVQATSGATSIVGDELAFVSDLAQETATDFSALAGSYGKFSAAAKLSGASLEEVHKIFTAVSKAGRVLKLSGDDLRLSFLALEQMFSKGKVSTEELRRQLGERIPGAFSLAAKAMGVTTAELDKMLRSGEVVATELLPKLADELDKAFSGGLQNALQSAQAAMTNFTNATFKMREAFGRAFFDGFKAELNDLSSTLNSPSFQESAAIFGELLGKALGTVLIIVNELVSAFNALNQVLSGIINIVKSAAAGIKSLGDALGVTSSSATFVKDALYAVSSAVLGAVAPITRLVSAYQTAADAHKKFAESLTPTAAQLAKLNPELNELREELSNMALDMGMSAIEANKFADEMVTVTASAQQMAEAIDKNIESLEKQVETIDENIEKLKQNFVALSRMAEAQGEVTPAMAKAFTEMERQIKALTEMKNIREGQIQASKDEKLAYELTADAVGEYGASALTAGNNLGDASENFEAARQKVDALKGSLLDSIGALFSFGGPAEKAGEDVKQAADKVSLLEERLNSFPSETAGAEQALNDTAGAMQKTGDAAGDTTSIWGQLGGVFGAAIHGLLGINSAAAETVTKWSRTNEVVGGFEVPAGAVAASANKASKSMKDLSSSADKANKSTTPLVGSSDQLDRALSRGQIQTEHLVVKQRNLAEALDQTQGSITTANENISDYSGTLTGAKLGVEGIASAHSAVVTSIEPLKQGLPTVGAAFSKLGETSTTVAPLLQPIANSMNIAAASTQVLVTTLPQINSSFAAMSTIIETLSTTLNGVKDGFEGIANVNERIAQIRATFDQLKEGVITAAAAFTKIVEAMNSVDSASETAKGGLTRLDDAMSVQKDHIAQLIEAIDELVKYYIKLEKAAKDAADQIARTGGGAGGDNTTAGSNRYGGYSGSAIESQAVSTKAFNGAPKLAEGTANTNSFVRKLGGGGIPSVLHPNEAVVPLPKGREIPVDLKIDAPESTGGAEIAQVASSISNVASAVQSLSKSVSAIQVPRIELPSMEMPKMEPVKLDMTEFKSEMKKGADQAVRLTQRQGDTTFREPPTNNSYRNLPRDNSGNGSGVSQNTDPRTRANIIQVTIQASDYDSFKRSEDQIVRDLGTKLSRATRRIGK